MTVRHSMVGQVSASRLFDKIKISLAGPKEILAESYGEVLTQETINYRTLKPEPGGLFACDIFGPVKDYECLCGKYKRMKYRGLVCEKCGVEVTTSKVRRERMGHIQLAAPVAHIWFLKSQPSCIATLLDFPLKDLERVLYFESHIVVDPGSTPLSYGDLLSDDALMQAEDQYGPESFRVLIGAEAIKEMLKNVQLERERASLREQMASTQSETKRKRYAKRLQLVENFIDSGNSPEWMVLDVLPVIPPDIRPLVMLDGGRFATSDLNEMYRRVIIRNNRLKRLIELNAPDIIVRNEKRMLQEAVDILFDNGKRGRALKSGTKRPFKSLSDMLKGKQGRFRQNLLGKRVDYSGRSVIVAGPTLKLHQCGLPKKMALELFKPFIYAKLELYGIATTIKTAKRMVESERPEVWDILEEVIYEHPVLLNRAPTLHRLGIQAFEPLLIEGKAIQLHPLVCTAFNADFDGDQMAVHVPLSIEAQVEARVLMMSTNNILSPSHGKPIIAPSLDIVLGIYYATVALPDQPGQNMVFRDTSEMRHALHHGVITLHSWIRCRALLSDPDGKMSWKLVETTPGRLMLAELVPEGCYVPFELFNRVLVKKDISSLIDMVYRHCGQKNTVLFADRVMIFGFQHACRSGVSIGKDDMVIPSTKAAHIQETLHEVKQYEMQHADGLITVGEKYNKVVDEWSECGDRIGQEVMRSISADFDQRGMASRPLNSIFMMAHSGTRGSAGQINQIAGMRGLMVRPDGRIIEWPIVANFKEGLTMHQCFISTHGTRKGLTDTALKTANSGYLTRRLVDVAQDCIVLEDDCGTDDGLIAKPVIQDGEVLVPIADIVLGRVSAIEVRHPGTQQVILARSELMTEAAVERVSEAGIDSIKVRSVLTCKTVGGVCASCYGRDLATGNKVSMGEAVGVIAAQSIGEPGTQLTMRTFHVGGAAMRGVEVSSIDAPYDARVMLRHQHLVTNSQGHRIMMSRNAELLLLDEHQQEKSRHKVPYGSRVFVEDDARVTRGDRLAEWDPYTVVILSGIKGRVSFRDLKDGVSVREIVDEAIGVSNRVITDSKQYARGVELRPHMVLLDDKGEVVVLPNGLEAKYFLPVNAVLNVFDAVEVSPGDVLARIPRESGKTRDITGGLTRVVELVEARRPKDHAIISEEEGYVEFGKDYKSKRRIIVNPRQENKSPVEYLIPKGKHITVNEGDYVHKGDLLMDGHPVPHEILKVMGVEALSQYMIAEIQQAYRLQGVRIDDKHIEVILRQMLQKVEVEDSGETTLLVGEQIDREEFEAINKKAEHKGYQPAKGSPVLQGITRASLQTGSWISAASFQQTTRVLTEAAVAGKIDELRGLKENIIVGRLIPAGTGFYMEKVKRQALKKERSSLLSCDVTESLGDGEGSTNASAAS